MLHLFKFLNVIRLPGARKIIMIFLLYCIIEKDTVHFCININFFMYLFFTISTICDGYALENSKASEKALSFVDVRNSEKSHKLQPFINGLAIKNGKSNSGVMLIDHQ